ncbi:MAG: QueT transporter family protein [Ruminococcus sp.]|nr:QueT transporter family protein [Ruminococcus sp.]
MEAIGTRRVVRIGVIALFYALLSFATSSLSCDDIPIRLAEMFLVLCLYSKDSVAAVTMGSFAVNVFGPHSAYEVIIGTLATLTAGILICLMRNRVGSLGVIIAALISAAVNAPAVGAMIFLNGGGDIKTEVIRTAISEFFTVLIAGAALYYYVKRVKRMKTFLSDDVSVSAHG